MALRLPFSFQQAQHAQVFPLKPAPFCKLFAGLGSTNKSATSLLLQSDSCSVLSSIFPFTLICCLVWCFFFVYFYLNISGRNFFLFPPVLSGYDGSLDTRFSRPTTRLMSWPDGECYLFPQQSLVVSLLFSLVSIFLFSRTGGILSHLNFSTHRIHRFPPRNLCCYIMLAVFSLVYAGTDTVFC